MFLHDSDILSNISECSVTMNGILIGNQHATAAQKKTHVNLLIATPKVDNFPSEETQEERGNPKSNQVTQRLERTHCFHIQDFPQCVLL